VIPGMVNRSIILNQAPFLMKAMSGQVWTFVHPYPNNLRI
jgi:hypothetical protein